MAKRKAIGNIYAVRLPKFYTHVLKNNEPYDPFKHVSKMGVILDGDKVRLKIPANLEDFERQADELANDDSGALAISDPRYGASANTNDAYEATFPADHDRGNVLIIAEDGTRHRPLTTFELAMLQEFPRYLPNGMPFQLVDCSDAKVDKSLLIDIKSNDLPFLWGWPDKFLNRMEEADTRVMIVGGDGRFSSGFDSLEDLKRLPEGYSGVIWTNRIDRIAPAYKSVVKQIKTKVRA